MIDNTAKPGQTDSDILQAVVRIANPIANRFHQSEYSAWEVILPVGPRTRFVMPLAAAIAVEEAGYLIELVGVLANGGLYSRSA
jgi:hypothetical protein